MRCSAPPEKLLKKSSTPPLVLSNSEASACGSMPGSGTKLSRRKTTSAPIVNHSRFLRSVACANLLRLRPAAAWLAADAMGNQNPRKRKRRVASLRPPPPYKHLSGLSKPYAVFGPKDSSRLDRREAALLAIGVADAFLLGGGLLGGRNPLDALARTAGLLDRGLRARRD